VKNSRLKLFIASVVVVSSAAFGMLPAQAATAPVCNGKYSDSNNVASTICQGFGQAKLIVICDGIFGLFGWTDSGSWQTVAGSYIITNAHAGCGSTLSYRTESRL
jgi:hypothetical protein